MPLERLFGYTIRLDASSCSVTQDAISREYDRSRRRAQMGIHPKLGGSWRGVPLAADGRAAKELARDLLLSDRLTGNSRSSRLKTVVLGGTKGIGRALSRALVERAEPVFLLGRDRQDLERSARDLEARSSADITVGMAHCDLEQPTTFDAALDEADKALGKFDTVIVTAGLFAPQDELERDHELASRLLEINFAHTIGFCELAKERLLDRGGGSLCVLSSVAGDRGRKPVGIYGASKAGLSHYLESLDHQYHARGLHVLCVKPGFVKTGMTAGLPVPPFAGEADGVARDILRALSRKKPLLYTPAMWRWVMFVIRRLPRFVMRRIDF